MGILMEVMSGTELQRTLPPTEPVNFSLVRSGLRQCHEVLGAAIVAAPSMHLVVYTSAVFGELVRSGESLVTAQALVLFVRCIEAVEGRGRPVGCMGMRNCTGLLTHGARRFSPKFPL